MSGRKSYVSWGEGIAYDDVNGLFFPAVEQVTFNFGMEQIEIPDGDSMTDAHQVVKMPLTGHISFGKLNADLWAMLTGASATAGGRIRVRAEAKTASGATFSLGATPSPYSELIYKVGSGIMKRVSTGPSGNEYTLSGKVVTVAASGGTASYLCDYLKATTTGQRQVPVYSSNSPSTFGLVSTFRAVDKDSVTETKGDIIIVCPKVSRSSGISFGGGNRAQNKVEFDFTIESTPGNPLYRFIFPSA